VALPGVWTEPGRSLGVAWLEPEDSLRVYSGWLRGAYRLATRWLEGSLGVAWGGRDLELQMADGKWPIGRRGVPKSSTGRV
jgi:hypothetical protein